MKQENKCSDLELATDTVKTMLAELGMGQYPKNWLPRILLPCSQSWGWRFWVDKLSGFSTLIISQLYADPDGIPVPDPI